MVIAFPAPSTRPHLGRPPATARPKRSAALVQMARRLAQAVADAADADQWAIAVVGLPELGAPDFQDLVPRRWLEILNGGRPARYRITLMLEWGGRAYGVVRLGTIRPDGFSELEIARARREAAHTAEQLAHAFAAPVPEITA